MSAMKPMNRRAALTTLASASLFAVLPFDGQAQTVPDAAFGGYDLVAADGGVSTYPSPGQPFCGSAGGVSMLRPPALMPCCSSQARMSARLTFPPWHRDRRWRSAA